MTAEIGPFGIFLCPILQGDSGGYKKEGGNERI